MKLSQPLAMLALSLAMLIPSISNAAIVFPALDIQDFGDDAGVSLTSTTLDIDATVLVIILDEFSNINNIADQTFTLTATGSSSVFDEATPIGTLTFIEGLFDGTFTVGGGLLEGSFTGLVISGLASQPKIEGDVTYTGGSLQGSLVGGRIELVTAGTLVSGKLGAVVPVPAAIWLFGFGLLGLVGVARRKQA